MSMIPPSPDVGELRADLERAGRRCALLVEELALARAERDELVVAVSALGMSRRDVARVARVNLSSVQRALERVGVVAPVPSRRHLHSGYTNGRADSRGPTLRRTRTDER
jgi:hypothetical protein